MHAVCRRGASTRQCGACTVYALCRLRLSPRSHVACTETRSPCRSRPECMRCAGAVRRAACALPARRSPRVSRCSRGDWATILSACNDTPRRMRRAGPVRHSASTLHAPPVRLSSSRSGALVGPVSSGSGRFVEPVPPPVVDLFDLRLVQLAGRCPYFAVVEPDQLRAVGQVPRRCYRQGLHTGGCESVLVKIAPGFFPLQRPQQSGGRLLGQRGDRAVSLPRCVGQLGFPFLYSVGPGSSAASCRGSPPRVRGGIAPGQGHHPRRRFTPAWAGQPCVFSSRRRFRDASAPRMRGSLQQSLRQLVGLRFSPARAGRQPGHLLQAGRATVHSRACGPARASGLLVAELTGGACGASPCPGADASVPQALPPLGVPALQLAGWIWNFSWCHGISPRSISLARPAFLWVLAMTARQGLPVRRCISAAWLRARSASCRSPV